MPLIRPATSAEDLDAVRQLCWDFRDHLMQISAASAQMAETFYPVPKYTRLLSQLETEHARPQGIILLAKVDNTPVGCAMTHALDARTSEAKRVFVGPQARGLGLARQLMTACMDQARADGYTRMVLDTASSLKPAQALYENLGFQRCEPYQDLPASALPHLVFFEKSL